MSDMVIGNMAEETDDNLETQYSSLPESPTRSDEQATFNTTGAAEGPAERPSDHVVDVRNVSVQDSVNDFGKEETSDKEVANLSDEDIRSLKSVFKETSSDNVVRVGGEDVDDAEESSNVQNGPHKDIDQVIKEQKLCCAWDFMGPDFSRLQGQRQFYLMMVGGLLFSAVFGVLTGVSYREQQVCSTSSLTPVTISSLTFCVLRYQAFYLYHIQPFEANDYRLGEVTYVMMADRTGFYMNVDIDVVDDDQSDGTFQMLLFTEDNFNAWLEGTSIDYAANYSRRGVSSVSMDEVYVPNEEGDLYFLVVQPCTTSSVCEGCDCEAESGDSLEPQNEDDAVGLGFNTEVPESQTLQTVNLFIDMEPESCLEDGHFWILILLLPWPICIFFGLRLHKYLRGILFSDTPYRSYPTILREEMEAELATPDGEIDYIQPIPWDRKVPKIRLFVFWCWNKFNRPTESFWTWWRHDNYLFWIWYPYRNERMSFRERVLIIYNAALITFTIGLTVAVLDIDESQQSLVAQLLFTLVIVIFGPTLGRTVFKEIYKAVYRGRRKRFRKLRARKTLKAIQRLEEENSGELTAEQIEQVKAQQQDMFRDWICELACDALMMLIISCVHIPLILTVIERSCRFSLIFVFLFTGMMIAKYTYLGSFGDLIYYSLLLKFGHNILCTRCTERIIHCECFNDYLLAVGVKNLGKNWDLILEIDRSVFGPERRQFGIYDSEMLRIRWESLVDRAEGVLRRYDNYDDSDGEETSNDAPEVAKTLQEGEGTQPTNGERKSGNVLTRATSPNILEEIGRLPSIGIIKDWEKRQQEKVEKARKIVDINSEAEERERRKSTGDAPAVDMDDCARFVRLGAPYTASNADERGQFMELQRQQQEDQADLRTLLRSAFTTHEPSFVVVEPTHVDG